MKKLPLIVLSVLFLIAGSAFTQRDVKNHCDYKKSRDKSRKALRPYNYSAQKSPRITLKNRKQFKELAVPLLRDSKYRFVFNTEGLPGKVEVKLYKKPVSESDRKVLFEKKSSGGQFTYETEKKREYDKLYIDLVYPAKETDDPKDVIRGCIVILAGYQVEFDDPTEKESDDGFLSNLFGGDDKSKNGGSKNEGSEGE